MSNRYLLASALLALASFSSASNATAPTCSVGQYCIDFESDNYYAHSSDQDAQASGDWSQVIDDEYVNAFDGISVQFWTSASTSDYSSGAPTVFPTTTGTANYEELITPNANNSAAPNNNGAAPYLVLFDTHAEGTKDPDLQVDTSNIAIIYEEDNPYSECKDVAGEKICKHPDDRYQGSSDPHGGFVFVHFSEPVYVHAIDLIDIETGTNQRGSFGFYDNTTNLIDDTNKTMVAMQYDSGSMGDGDHGTQTFSTDYSSLSITTLVIRMQGSGGFDNIAFSRVNEVPEPSSLALFTLGLLGLTRLKKKADKS